MPSIGSYAIVLVVVAATTFATLFGIRRFAFRIGAVVRPDARHVHERPTPTLGGVAMLLGVLVGMFTAWCMGSFDAVFAGSTEPLGLVIAAVVIAVVGVIDDLKDVSAPAKIAGIVLAASVLVISGISILVFRIPFAGVFVLSTDWSLVWPMRSTSSMASMVWLAALSPSAQQRSSFMPTNSAAKDSWPLATLDLSSPSLPWARALAFFPTTFTPPKFSWVMRGHYSSVC